MISYEGGILMFEICALLKEVPQSSLPLPPSDDTMREVGSLPFRRGPSSQPNSAGALISTFQPPKL